MRVSAIVEVSVAMVVLIQADFYSSLSSHPKSSDAERQKMFGAQGGDRTRRDPRTLLRAVSGGWKLTSHTGHLRYVPVPVPSFVLLITCCGVVPSFMVRANYPLLHVGYVRHLSLNRD